MSVLDALKGVLKIALIHDGLARGLREASKALDRRQAHMCVLNENCEEEAYKKLVVALCSEHKIPLIKVPDGKQLGEWAGLCTSSLIFGMMTSADGCRPDRPRGERQEGGQLLLRRGAGLGRGVAGAQHPAELLPDGAVGVGYIRYTLAL
jgi:ribosomal protein L7Ae-like RNA K-turn-binding protein